MASTESGIVVLNSGEYPGRTLRKALTPAISYRITGGDYADVTPVGDRWEHRRWTIHLYNPATGKRMQFGYMTGMAIDKPEILEALYSTVRDAHSVEWWEFGPEWAEEFGYDWETDRKKAERIYNECERTDARLTAFYGDDRTAWELYIEEAGA